VSEEVMLIPKSLVRAWRYMWKIYAFVLDVQKVQILGRGIDLSIGKILRDSEFLKPKPSDFCQGFGPDPDIPNRNPLIMVDYVQIIFSTFHSEDPQKDAFLDSLDQISM